jgi:hypothetical protein
MHDQHSFIIQQFIQNAGNLGYTAFLSKPLQSFYHLRYDIYGTRYTSRTYCNSDQQPVIYELFYSKQQGSTVNEVNVDVILAFKDIETKAEWMLTHG